MKGLFIWDDILLCCEYLRNMCRMKANQLQRTHQTKSDEGKMQNKNKDGDDTEELEEHH